MAGILDLRWKSAESTHRLRFLIIKRNLCMVAAVAALMSIPLLHGQDKPARLTFEVESIKLAKPGAIAGGIKAMPGGQEYLA